jgi:hypothetical protein
MEADPVAPTFDEPIETLRARIARNLGVVVASKNLSPPHVAFRRQVEDDARQAAQSRWHAPIFDKPLEKRRVRILQGLFYGLSRLDCTIAVQGRETRTISIGVGHQHVWIALEQAAQRRRSSDDKQVERLKFSILKGYGSTTERVSWVDKEEQALEAQLSTIAAEIIVAGEMQYREHLVWMYEDSLRREEMQQADTRGESKKHLNMASGYARHLNIDVFDGA